MTSTEDIVRKRKQGADTAGRRDFSVDRSRAIEKMRRFALEDPRYYLLELIQAAIANGAGFLSIDLFRLRTERDDLKMRWTGRGFSNLELSRLFDFLFMRDDEPGCADSILLARGINAMLHFRPQRITISCGDGTIDGSRRFAIRDGEPQLVPVPLVETIDGVQLHAEGLRSSLLPPGPHQQFGDREVELLQEKCVAPTVRVMLNGRWVSGWNAAYAEQIDTGSDYVEINEPDLYGRLWMPMTGRPARFDLMTWGVKIESVEREESPFGGLRGAINYNLLNKTADHARIVRDEMLDELWARLEPYASKLQRGGGAITYDIYNLDGERFRPLPLLELVRDAERVVAVPPTVLDDDDARLTAREIGHALEAPVVVAWERAQQTLRRLAGSTCEVVAPSLDEKRDIELFSSQPASPPARPWLTEPLEVESVAIDDFVRHLCEAEHVEERHHARIERALGTSGEVDLRVYTPERDGHGDTRLRRRWVRVLICERLIWEGEVDTVFPGHRLYVELPTVSPAALEQKISVEDGSNRSREVRLMRLVAQTAVALARRELRRASERALRSLGRVEVEPGSLGARLALYALGREGVFRVRSDGRTGGSRVVLSVFDDASVALLDVALFYTVDGQKVTARAIGQMLDDNGGLVYGTLDEREADLSGLDTSRVLALDAEQEQLVVSLVGADAYVRVDRRRDALAEYRGVEVRDVAVGLLDYPEFPLWVEGADVSKMPESEQVEVARALAAQLVDLLGQAGSEWHHQEARRQARRHLLRFLVWCEHSSQDAAGVDQLKLLDTVDAGRCSFRCLMEALEEDDGVVMVDGRTVDLVEPLTQQEHEHDSQLVELRLNPFLLYLMERLAPIRGAVDFDLSLAEAKENDDSPATAFIAEGHIDEREVRGAVGLPVEPVEQPAIAVIERDSRDVHLLREPARKLGLVGRVVVSAQMLARPDRLEKVIMDCGEDVLERLVAAVPRLDDDAERHRVVEALLDFAATHLELTAVEGSKTFYTVSHPLAERIFELPLFRTGGGTPASARVLIGQFCRALDSGEPFSSPLVEGQSPYLERWIRTHLDASAVYQRAPAAAEGAATWHRGGDEFLEHVAEWLQRLRPDSSQHTVTELRWLDTPVEDHDTSVSCLYLPGHGLTIYLNPEHPLVQGAQQAHGRAARPLAWLLLAIYAAINNRLELVTNDHELAFQRRVADALEQGLLG